MPSTQIGNAWASIWEEGVWGPIWSLDELPPVGDPPVAAFSATPLSGDAPLEVTFTDESTNSPTSWYWDFGDGFTSTEENPVHEYNVFGSVTVTLIVGNESGTDFTVRENYITITNPNPPPPGSLIRKLLSIAGARRRILGFRQRNES